MKPAFQRNIYNEINDALIVIKKIRNLACLFYDLLNFILSADKLEAVFTLLEAFGNSRTIMNTSATDVIQIISFDFDHIGQIVSASVQAMMMEKSRIVRRPESEPTFNIMCQMFAGLDATLRLVFSVPISSGIRNDIQVCALFTR